MAKWTRKGPLGLTLNTNNHTVERNSQSVSFGSNGRPWEVFVKLAGQHPGRYLPKDLGHDVWNPDGREVDPEDNVVQQAITTIRGILQPLGIGVSHTRKLGYILAESPIAATIPNNKKPSKRKPR
jgi:hypothetical protein